MKATALPLEALFQLFSTNFNANLAAVADDYQIVPFDITFPQTLYSLSTSSFFVGQLPADFIDEFGPSDLSKMSMFILQASNQNIEKPRSFSGPVLVGIKFWNYFLSNNTSQNLDALGLAVDDAVLETVNGSGGNGVYQVNWGPGVIYNGQVSVVHRSIEVPADGNGSFRQELSYTLGFEVNV